jgi:hypothetical protein
MSMSTGPTILVTRDDFDWGDAGIGAAGVLFVALVTVGGIAAARSHAGRRALGGAAVLMVLVPTSVAGAQDRPGPSCNGVFSSSAAGDPGHVAEAAHAVKELSEVFGVPPGAFNSAGARLHCEP